MKTSLVILGVVALTYGASQYFDADKQTETPIQQELKNPKLQSRWNISRNDHNTECVFTTIAGSENLVQPVSSNACSDIVKGLRQLSQIKMEENGDITLYSQKGDRIAQFIETESASHDSIWPSYPLLSLAKLD